MRVTSTPTADAEGRDVGASSPGLWRIIYLLAGLAVFLVALILVVLLARSLRATFRAAEQSSGLSESEAIAQLGAGPSDADRQEAARAILASGPAAIRVALEKLAPKPIPDRPDQIALPPKVARAFMELGPPAVEGLVASLASPQANARAAAALVLRDMVPAPRDARDALTTALADSEPRVRWFAIETLGAMGADAAPAVPALTDLVEHREPYTRRRAIEALGRIGPAARPAEPALERIAREAQDPSMQQMAKTALDQVQLDARVANARQKADPQVRQLIAKLLGDNQFEAVAAAKTLGDLGVAGRESTPALGQALRHKNKWIREAAAIALEKLGLYSTDVLPLLYTASKEPEPEVRAAADRALKQLEGSLPR